MFSQHPNSSGVCKQLVAAVAALHLVAALVGCALAVGPGVFYQGPGVTAAETLRARGYIAHELFITTSDGYVLRLTRGRNPLIKGGSLASKDAVFFVHGALAAANNFLVNSFGARPRDFTHIDLLDIGDSDKLYDRLAGDPSVASLPLLASNFGHEIWLLDRRGVPGSQQRVGDPLSIKAKPSRKMPVLGGTIMESVANLMVGPLLARQTLFALDQKYWNFSLDEQARIDFPECVDFILARTRSTTGRVAVVAHSAGGAVSLMALSLYPDTLPPKLSSCILWSPAFALGLDNPYFERVYGPLVPLANVLTIPVPPSFLTDFIQALAMAVCSAPALQRTLCESFADVTFGESGGREPIKPQLLGSFLFPSSSHALGQLGQAIRYPNHTLHRFDFAGGNMAVYGQPEPPAYDLSVLRNFSRISFYIGATDKLVTPADVRRARAQLTVSSRYHQIETTYNHIGYFFHEDAPRLAIVPSMLELESLAAD